MLYLGGDSGYLHLFHSADGGQAVPRSDSEVAETWSGFLHPCLYPAAIFLLRRLAEGKGKVILFCVI